MKITDSNERIKLSFNLAGSDGETSIYLFEIPNLGSNFENLKFNDINDTITEQELKQKQLQSITKLAKLNFCELQYLLADTDKVFLIKKVNEINYIYNLVYWGTRRGWEFSKH
ncbi:hypothetical protein [Winogradskyella sp.]|uniref:hypothetical protein n=1 Tax=Winogradskyella sp. TaxID=1883156 RepID=UPI0035C87518